ncbi:hypothetical protein NFI96_031823 [Prochilodus magdalenae]|nr:hypothetical protein NFI96_031823 [Prochilodus magdalenae]
MDSTDRQHSLTLQHLEMLNTCKTDYLSKSHLKVTRVWFTRISGADVEMRVRPGDDVVLYSDCVWNYGFDTVWFRNSSHEHMVLLEGSHPRYSIMSNVFHQTTYLLVKNVNESDLGLYFCALQKKRSSRDRARACSWEDVCYYRNRTTRLSFHGKDPHSDLLSPNVHPSLLLSDMAFSYPTQPTRPPPSTRPPPPLLYQTVVSAGSSWSVCVLCVSSSPQSSPPPVCTASTEAELKVLTVHSIRHSYLAAPPCRWTVRDDSSSAAAQCSVGDPLVFVTVEQRDDVGERERPRSRNRDKSLFPCKTNMATVQCAFIQPQVGGDNVCYASLDLPSRGQKQLKKKKRAESSDFCTYAKVKLDQS